MIKYSQSQEPAREAVIVTLKNWEDVRMNEKNQDNTPPARIQQGLMQQSKKLGSSENKQTGESMRGMMGWTLPRYSDHMEKVEMRCYGVELERDTKCLNFPYTSLSS